MAESHYQPCLSLRGVLLGLLGIFLAHAFIHYTTSPGNLDERFGQEGLPMAAVIVLLLFLTAIGLLHMLTRYRLVQPGELFFATAATAISIPLALGGFWRYSLNAINTVTSPTKWERYDSVPWEIRPHRADVFARLRETPPGWSVSSEGNVSATDTAHSRGETATAIRMENRSPDDHAIYRIEIPLETDGEANLHLGIEYLFTLLVRAGEFAGDTRFNALFHYDDDPLTRRELTNLYRSTRPTYLQPEGYERLGHLNVVFARDGPHEKIVFTFSLEGTGTVELADLRLLDISPLAGTAKGLPLIKRSAWEQLPPWQQGGYLVRPDRLASPAGLLFLVTGYVPWKPWLPTIAIFGAWTILLLAATFGAVLILRKQWMESERFAMPVDQPVIALLDPGDGRRTLPAILRNPPFWFGVTAALAWYAFVLGHEFIGAIPNPQSPIGISSYIDNPIWGKTWRINLVIEPFFLGLVLFMELNVLASAFLGFLFYRLQHFVGLQTGWAVDGAYPYERHQMIGNFGTYAVVTLLLTHRHLRHVARKLFIRSDPHPDSETPAYRAGAALIAASLLGILLWAGLLGLPLVPVAGYFGALLILAIGAARIRTEAGIHHANAFSHWGHHTLPQLVFPLIGGIAFFSIEGVGLLTTMAIALTGSVVYLIPGLQLTFLQLGRRWRYRGTHVASAVALGVVGGIVIGGWITLSSAYALGVDNYLINGHYGGIQATWGPVEEVLVNAETGGSGESDPGFFAMLYGGGLTGLVIVLRQLFAGFWFHPIGVLIAPSAAMHQLWAVFPAAFLIRFAFLKLGGASTIRDQLQPFATGLVTGSALAYLLIFLVKVVVEFDRPGLIDLAR